MYIVCVWKLHDTRQLAIFILMRMHVITLTKLQLKKNRQNSTSFGINVYLCIINVGLPLYLYRLIYGLRVSELNSIHIHM